ncbi:MAG: ABC transporter ATP-binding protein [Pseudomonadota bacterium]
MSPVLEFKSVTKSLGRKSMQQIILKDISFQVKTGDIAVFVGPSGSGKTTLLTLAGLLDTPDSGEILIDGISTIKAGSRALATHRRHDLGFIFQSFNLIPVLTALENVEMALHGIEKNAGARRAKAREALVQVGLKGMEHRRPGNLSGGQQQRVGIARGLVRRPKLMIADEPTANLDRDTRDDVVDLLRGLAANFNQTLLISTHDPMVADIADQRFQIDRGRLVEEALQC